LKKNIIKKLGMEKEFKNWVKNIESRQGIDIGSRVELIENFRIYPIGAKGTVKGSKPSRLEPGIRLLTVSLDNYETTHIYDKRFKLIK